MMNRNSIKQQHQAPPPPNDRFFDDDDHTTFTTTSTPHHHHHHHHHNTHSRGPTPTNFTTATAATPSHYNTYSTMNNNNNNNIGDDLNFFNSDFNVVVNSNNTTTNQPNLTTTTPMSSSTSPPPTLRSSSSATTMDIHHGNTPTPNHLLGNMSTISPNNNNNNNSFWSPNGSFFSNAFFGGNNNDNANNNNMNNNFFNPNAMAADFMVGMGMDHMNKMHATTSSKYWAFFHHMKSYFDVNNSYVLYKLLSILFPFVKKWNRYSSSTTPNSNNSHNSPTMSENGVRDLKQPDLYIPSMFFISYILLVCGLLGSKNEFTPELLTSMASTGLVITLVEIFIVKLGFYLLSVPGSISLLDMCAYSGYKYVGVVLTILISTLVDARTYFPVCILSSLMMSLFLIKTLRRACVASSDQYSMRLQLDGMSSQRSMFIFVVSLLQIPIFLLLTYRYSRDEYNVVAALVRRAATTAAAAATATTTAAQQ